MENLKTGQGLKSRSCGVGAVGSGSAFPAGGDDPESSRGGTGNFQILKFRFNVQGWNSELSIVLCSQF